MRRGLGLTLIGALLCGLDVPATAVQACAWAVMLARGARIHSAAQAVSETFDGLHPCSVCLRLKRAEPAPSLRAVPSAAKPDFFPPSGARPDAPRADAAAAPRRNRAAFAACAPPATPPPKTLAA